MNRFFIYIFLWILSIVVGLSLISPGIYWFVNWINPEDKLTYLCDLFGIFWVSVLLFSLYRDIKNNE